MIHQFILNVKTFPKEYRAQFTLTDSDKVHLAASEVKLKEFDPALWEGLFNMRDYVRRYAGYSDPERHSHMRSEKEIVRDLGVFLARSVLGDEVFSQLYEGIHERTLLVRLPDTSDDPLAGAFARVPWEIARPSVDEEAVYQRNLSVRVISGDMSQKSVGVSLEPHEPLRVLLVFSEAEGSSPLALRLERERLIELFYDEIMAERKVQVDVLCHGVTVERIEEQVKAARGYHIVHWSGHGYHDVLEVYSDDRTKKVITSAEFVNLFSRSGGWIPLLVFLSACHSGSLITARDWASLKAILQKQGDLAEPEKESDAVSIDTTIAESKGYTGTALNLIKAGVSQVVAMRYEVGDAYARRLARRFYKHLIREGYSADHALGLSRSELAHDRERQAEHSASDHATPLIFGNSLVTLTAQKGRSEQLNTRYPRPSQVLLETDLRRPQGFVGRNRELTRLVIHWLPKEGFPVAIIQSLAGMGKTMLAAEAIHLWHERFDWVLAVQSRYPVSAEEFFQKIHSELLFTSPVYRERSEANVYSQIWIDRSVKTQRYERMLNNLIEALRMERVLVILDNFETNLFEDLSCSDEVWTVVLEALCMRLKGSFSKVLITSRHMPKALRDSALWLPLGPLSMKEARLFFQNKKHLRRLWYNPEYFHLAVRVLEISRGHPLILERLGRIARDIKALEPILESLEREGFHDLAGVADAREREKERKYLEEVSHAAIDTLINRLSQSAAHLLWVLTRAFEPVEVSVLKGVWGGKSVEDEELNQARQMYKMAAMLPPEVRAQFEAEFSTQPQEVRALIEQEP
jgi:hypothetical protein